MVILSEPLAEAEELTAFAVNRNAIFSWTPFTAPPARFETRSVTLLRATMLALGDRDNVLMLLVSGPCPLCVTVVFSQRARVCVCVCVLMVHRVREARAHPKLILGGPPTQHAEPLSFAGCSWETEVQKQRLPTPSPDEASLAAGASPAANGSDGTDGSGGANEGGGESGGMYVAQSPSGCCLWLM